MTGGEVHGEFANHRYDTDRTEHKQATEVGWFIGKGLTGYIGVSNTIGSNPAANVKSRKYNKFFRRYEKGRKGVTRVPDIHYNEFS